MKLPKLAGWFIDRCRRVFMLTTGDDPVTSLLKILPLEMPQDWEILDNPEEDLLYVPRGTILKLLRDVGGRKLWLPLVERGVQLSEVWLVDLSYFFPNEEAFIEPLKLCLLSVRTDHAKVVFAQSAADWPWGADTLWQLPQVIDRVTQIAREVSDTVPPACVRNLDRVVDCLKNIHTSGCPVHRVDTNTPKA